VPALRHPLAILKLQLLTDGYFTLDKSFLVFGKYQGTKFKAALKPLLVETERDKILIDTGIGTLPAKYLGHHQVIRENEQQLIQSLQRAGRDPSDITLVVNTHLHFDHCGNNRLFSHAKFVSQVDEIRYAFYPDRFMRISYLREFFDLEGDFLPVRGRHVIDDGVEILPTPGHSLGHQSVVIRWKGRNIVYTGDAAPLPENIEKGNISGMVYDSGKASESIELLRSIKDPIYVHSHEDKEIQF